MRAKSFPLASWVVMAAGLSLGLAAGAEGGSMVEFPGGSGPVKGYLARPEGDGPFPAVIVIQEWWGLTDWIKKNADHLADQGYAALAVDLYHGRVAQDMNRARELATGLDHEEALADLKGGVAYLQSQGFVDKSQKMGVIGWCMGGGFARELAQAADAIGPTVICYGRVTENPADVARLKDNPILGIFGAEDRGIPAAGVEQFARAVKAAGGKAIDVHVYEGMGHAFMNPDNKAGYGQEAADDAWARIDKFFAEHLKTSRK